ncbi:MAG: hypothetical protein ACXWV6_10895 [Chitinophagaceae bacterium]
MKKVLQIANGVALVATIIINYLSNTGIFNGNTMAVVSARLQNLFTPAGYAFSIWGLIYLGLFAFVIYQGRSLFTEMADDRIVLKIGWWFVVSCISNCLWVLAWLYDYTGLSVLIMLSLLFSLTRIIVKLNMEREKVQLKESVFACWPFAIYSGWITVALIANIAAYLTKIQWGAWGISETSWAIIMICIAGVINLFVTWNRNMSEFALVGAWALVAIAVANRHVSQPVVQVALTVSVILFMSSAIHMFKTRKFLQ